MEQQLKALRKKLGLTQEEFATRLGIKRAAISNYEIGRNEPIDAVISLICREFNVNETWLRTGEGEMFAPEPVFDLTAYANRHGMTALETEILKAYLELDTNVRESLLQHFKERLTRPAPPAGKDIPAPAATGQERTQADTTGQAPPDIAAKVAELERQNRELAAKVAAMEEEDALYGLTGVSEASPGESVLNLNPKAKK